MKLQFKKQAYQSHAVEAVVDCFAGQRRSAGIRYRVDPGRASDEDRQIRMEQMEEVSGFKER